MTSEIKIERIYIDNELIKLRVSAWNGLFGGEADVYESVGRLSEIATLLQGFPSSVTDSREFGLGSFGDDSAGGGVSLRLFCRDRSGHIAAEVSIESDFDSNGKAQSVNLLFLCEAAAIDVFVAQLRNVDREIASEAHLAGTATNFET
jgi:hypothetical protein